MFWGMLCHEGLYALSMLAHALLVFVAIPVSQDSSPGTS